jgi:hypothetical protein
VGIGQPLSRESLDPGADAVSSAEGNTNKRQQLSAFFAPLEEGVRTQLHYLCLRQPRCPASFFCQVTMMRRRLLPVPSRASSRDCIQAEECKFSRRTVDLTRLAVASRQPPSLPKIS